MSNEIEDLLKNGHKVQIEKYLIYERLDQIILENVEENVIMALPENEKSYLLFYLNEYHNNKILELHFLIFIEFIYNLLMGDID